MIDWPISFHAYLLSPGAKRAWQSGKLNVLVMAVNPKIMTLHLRRTSYINKKIQAIPSYTQNGSCRSPNIVGLLRIYWLVLPGKRVTSTPRFCTLCTQTLDDQPVVYVGNSSLNCACPILKYRESVPLGQYQILGCKKTLDTQIFLGWIPPLFRGKPLALDNLEKYVFFGHPSHMRIASKSPLEVIWPNTNHSVDSMCIKVLAPKNCPKDGWLHNPSLLGPYLVGDWLTPWKL